MFSSLLGKLNLTGDNNNMEEIPSSDTPDNAECAQDQKDEVI